METFGNGRRNRILSGCLGTTRAARDGNAVVEVQSNLTLVGAWAPHAQRAMETQPIQQSIPPRPLLCLGTTRAARDGNVGVATDVIREPVGAWAPHAQRAMETCVELQLLWHDIVPGHHTRSARWKHRQPNREEGWYPLCLGTTRAARDGNSMIPLDPCCGARVPGHHTRSARWKHQTGLDLAHLGAQCLGTTRAARDGNVMKDRDKLEG